MMSYLKGCYCNLVHALVEFIIPGVAFSDLHPGDPPWFVLRGGLASATASATATVAAARQLE